MVADTVEVICFFVQLSKKEREVHRQIDPMLFQENKELPFQ